MATGTLTIRVRPLRIAFLVDLSDRRGLYQAIETSTFLWGGSYNAIIPAFRRAPRIWASHPIRRLESADAVVGGYLEAFDPDIVVPIGICEGRTFPIGHRELATLDDLLGDISQKHTSRIGIGLFEVLRNFIEKELKYQRSDDLRIVLPRLPRKHRLFFASIFGAPLAATESLLSEWLKTPFPVDRPSANLANYAELLKPNRFSLRRLTSWGMEHLPLHSPTIFVCDATSPLDVIDYWNLRAGGHYVIPVPLQAKERESARRFAAAFIEENYGPYRDNPAIFQHTTIQKSRSVSEHDVRAFLDSLSIDQPNHQTAPKYILRPWYPRLWDRWDREHNAAEVRFPFSHEVELRLSDGEDRMELRSQDPKFGLTGQYSGQARFANEFHFRFYGWREPMAEVIPEGGRELSTAIGRLGYSNWRFSQKGPVFLAHHANDLIFLDLPKAETVMCEWLRERGWKVTLSAPGRMALQLIKQLGGQWGITWLAHRGVIELLAELEKEGGLSRPAVTGRLQQIIRREKLLFDEERFLEGLINAGAMRLGGRVQCPVCTRHNWYELDNLGYTLNCRFCLSTFSAPIKSPKEIAWTYRAHGPFASSVAQGAFAVLLALKFLARDDERVTPMFSYTATKGSQRLEADLTCLLQESTWRETQTSVIHAECKSFGGFEKRDFSRMAALSLEFPGAALVFATLADELSADDKRKLRSLSVRERKKRHMRRPYSPVIVLTGLELFSMRGSPECWKGRDIYEEVSRQQYNESTCDLLADATQRLHLDMPSWFEWSEQEWKKRKARHAKSKALPTTTAEQR